MSFTLAAHDFFTLPYGGRMRYARIEPTGSPKGTVLIVPGRREFIEKKIAETGPLLLDLGYRLIIVEPRGQGLSSRFLDGAFYQRDHIDDFSTHLDDLRAFYQAIVQPAVTGKLIAHGHSMGGHLLLRWLAEDKPNVAGAFVTAPMLALAGMAAHLIAYGMSYASVRLLKHETHYAPHQHDFGGEDYMFEKNPLTQDAERFKIIENYFVAYPDLTVGGVTWGWLLAALRSMQQTHGSHYLANVGVPVLALVGDKDQVTPANEIGNYLNFIPRVRTHVIANARHDLLNEVEPVRRECWDYIGKFLAEITTA